MNQNCDCGISVEGLINFATEDQAISDFQQCTETEYPRCLSIAGQDEQRACVKSARFKCLEDSRLLEEFQCSAGLTDSECLDLYTIVLYRGKMTKDQLFSRIQEENLRNMKYFVDILETARIQHEAHYESPILENGEWNFDFGKKVENIKGLLKDVKESHREYLEYKNAGAFEMMDMVYKKTGPNIMDIKGMVQTQ